ncbi:transcriptional regulator [Halalkalibacter wakoensis JCM 9140]|uniref:Transcriptional regulator n=1 Tax=Halalkalibacter wakoensis JCM 9140 TaxID=1236970 RepID=W4PYT4_9BACI|nr:GntR family transcriptional regulator [Halalkalibacter wakoensis]GAE24971.1 transcriptional regulator [Halalkalibacter wakoensis JCM 9140]
MIQSDGSKPIYVQVSEWMETEILRGSFESDQKVYSQYQLADMFNINPATAAKGLNMLVNENILYKKRGLGLFVASNASEMILTRRKNENLANLVMDVVREAKHLHVTEQELIKMIQLSFTKKEDDK